MRERKNGVHGGTWEFGKIESEITPRFYKIRTPYLDDSQKVILPQMVLVEWMSKDNIHREAMANCEAAMDKAHENVKTTMVLVHDSESTIEWLYYVADMAQARAGMGRGAQVSGILHEWKLRGRCEYPAWHEDQRAPTLSKTAFTTLICCADSAACGGAGSPQSKPWSLKPALTAPAKLNCANT